MTATHLSNRSVLRLSSPQGGGEVRDFLQGLVTHDMTLLRAGEPLWAGLLSPQGKALFDFILWADGEDVLIDCEATAAEALARRLTLYRLRRAITIAPDDGLCVHWTPPSRLDQVEGRAPTCDPRLGALGHRWLAPSGQDHAADAAWLAHRLSLGVTEGVAELGSDATLWLECNAVELNGVSFKKGCYIGQENTARMNWRQKVNRRLVVVPIADADGKRLRIAYPDLGLAVVHARVEDMANWTLPEWLETAIGSPSA